MSEPVLYEVTLEVDPAVAAAVERYMREIHIPQIWSTGCFRQIRFERAGPTAFRTCYEAGTPADLDRYLRDHAAALRADVAEHFPTGLSISRVVWSPLASWP